MNEDELQSLIRRTHPKPEFAASFNREVWARVAAAEDRSWKARWREASERFFTSISRPAPAMALVTAMLIVGAGFGGLTAPESGKANLRSAYIQSINPLAAAGASENE